MVQAHRTTSNLLESHSKVCRVLSHEFGVVRLYRTFSVYSSSPRPPQSSSINTKRSLFRRSPFSALESQIRISGSSTHSTRSTLSSFIKEKISIEQSFSDWAPLLQPKEEHCCPPAQTRPVAGVHHLHTAVRGQHRAVCRRLPQDHALRHGLRHSQ